MCMAGCVMRYLVHQILQLVQDVQSLLCSRVAAVELVEQTPHYLDNTTTHSIQLNQHLSRDYRSGTVMITSCPIVDPQ